MYCWCCVVAIVVVVVLVFAAAFGDDVFVVVVAIVDVAVVVVVVIVVVVVVGVSLTGRSSKQTVLIFLVYNCLNLFLVISCSQPSPIPNADVTVVSSEYRGVAILSCAEGYQPEGDELIVCLHSALWSPTNFSCTGNF